jgi:hypothetical protein
MMPQKVGASHALTEAESSHRFEDVSDVTTSVLPYFTITGACEVVSLFLDSATEK